MSIALYPGSFDPPHMGHLDVAERVARHFPEVVVAVVANPSKSSVFTLEERKELLREVLSHLDNVKVDSFSGLTVDYAAALGSAVIVKGLRAVSDFDYELQMAVMNQTLAGIDTIFVAASPKTSFLSSSLIKEVALLGGDVSRLVPPAVEKLLREKFS